MQAVAHASVIIDDVDNATIWIEVCSHGFCSLLTWSDNPQVDLGQCATLFGAQIGTMTLHSLPSNWLPVSIAPSDEDLEVGVMRMGTVYTLVFPVRKSETGWVDASTKRFIDVQPTHWRKWTDGC